MSNELTNLLPPERAKSLSRDYLLRVTNIIVLCIIGLTLCAMILLIPTYVLLESSAQAKKIELTRIESTLSSIEDATLLARLTTLSKNADTLIALSNTPAISTVLRTLLAVSRPGITLSGFTYTPALDKTLNTITVSGSAVTREALRSYQIALQGLSFARSALLPVSAYAKNADIPFTITLPL